MRLIQSAKIVVLDANSKALLLRRGRTHRTQPLRPDLPGGVIEAGETIEAGLIREVQEEIGLTLKESELCLLYTKTYDTFPRLSVNRFLYVARLHEPTPAIALGWEHDSYHWVTIQELIELEAPYQEGIDYATTHRLWATV